jgi:PAS domain S-box-containing protein
MVRERAENQKTFEKDISALRRRLEAIATDNQLSDTARLEILFHDLSVSLEELEVTHEELLAANEVMEEARQQVESERQRYLDLFEGAPDGYVVTDAKGMILAVNTAAASMLNAREDFLAGKPLVLFVADEGKKEFHSRVTRLSSGVAEEVRQWELALKPRDLTPLPVLVSVSAVREAEGTSVRLRWLLRDITGRKKFEEELQFQKNLLEERVKELRCLHDIARVIERGAPLEETLRGIVAQIPPGWKYSQSACARIRAGDIECATPNFVETRWKQEQEIYARGRPVGSVEVCYRSQKPDAEEGPFLIEERHLLDIIAVRIGNVIERAWAEEALQESNARNQLLVESLSEGIWIVDEEAVTTYVNEQMAQMLGYRAEEMTGRPLQDFLPEEGGALIPEHLERRKRGIREKKEQTFLHKDGSPICTLMITSPIYDENGAFAGAIAGISDITDRKKMETDLLQSRERLKLAIEGAKLGVWDKDLVTGEVVTDAYWKSLLGFGPENPIPPWEEQVHPDDRRAALEIFRDHIRGNTPYAEATYRMKTREGRYVWILTRGKVVARDAKGRPRRMTGVDQNITALRDLQEGLREANRKLNLLSSITRHDILNQVTALKAFLHLEEERHCEDPESMDMFAKMKTITDTIRRQITFTGDYQNLGEQDPRWQQVTYVMKRAAESVMLKGISLTVSTGAIEVFADPMLEKAFYNLLDNAVVHGNVTAIEVSCQRKDEGCVIVVEDDGTGIPADQKEAIFRRGVGRITGYGLFLTQEILAITGMIIRETGEEGKGARFEITVPEGGCRVDGPPVP